MKKEFLQGAAVGGVVASILTGMIIINSSMSFDAPKDQGAPLPLGLIDALVGYLDKNNATHPETSETIVNSGFLTSDQQALLKDVHLYYLPNRELRTTSKELPILLYVRNKNNTYVFFSNDPERGVQYRRLR